MAGVSTIKNWVAQSDWNVDAMDGSGPSGINLDPTKGNVYQIRYQWLGFGPLSYFIEDSEDGDLHLVHIIKYANVNIVPSLQNPTLPLHIMSKNNANDSNLTIKTSSMGGFVEGRVIDLGLPNSRSNTITDLASTELPILSIKNKLVYQSAINRVRITPLFLALATESSKPVIFRLKLNPTLTGTPAFADVDADNSVVSVDIASSGITGGNEIFTIVLGKADSEIIDVSKIRKLLNPGEIFTITAEATSGTGQEVTVSLNWEDLF